MPKTQVVVSQLLNRVLPQAWLTETVGQSRFSRFAWPRWLTYDYDAERWRIHATRAEWNAWARENMPNGKCICYPERGIVCGQHDTRHN